MRGDLYLKEMIDLRGVPQIDLDSIGTSIFSRYELREGDRNPKRCAMTKLGLKRYINNQQR